jgi:hypothetical protein
MIPVDMIDVPSPDNPEAVGDCFRACIASIFELKAGEVPHFLKIELGTRYAWTYTLDQWLAPQGLWYCDFPTEVKTWCVHVPLDGVYAIGTGKSPRYPTWDHSVVVKLHRTEGMRIVHDPHPSRDGVTDGRITLVGMFLSRKVACKPVR